MFCDPDLLVDVFVLIFCVCGVVLPGDVQLVFFRVSFEVFFVFVEREVCHLDGQVGDGLYEVCGGVGVFDHLLVVFLPCLVAVGGCPHQF